MAHQFRFAGYASLVAAASLAFSPAKAQAAEVAPQGTAGYATGFLAQTTALNVSDGPLAPLATPGSDQVQEYRRYRRFRGRRGFRGYRGRRGIRGGDILAGALVIGGIAAIASAASKNRRRDRDVVVVERRVRDRDYDFRPENRRSTSRSTTGGAGIDNAVSMCLNEIEQDIRVDSVDGASRVGSGWIVTGSLFDGSGFSCQIDNSGRISGIDYGRGSGTSSLEGTQTFARAEGQLSDDRYANARAEVGGGTRPDLAIDPNDERLPAYPGGPLPGEELPE